MPSAAVRARSVTKTFGDVVALDAVDLTVLRGQIHGVVGPNGAGKTTLFGLLLGLATADAGELRILGRPADRVLGVPAGVAGFVDAPGLYPQLTARQNLQTLVDLRAGSRAGRREGRRAVDEALAQVGLLEVADDRLRGFSLGMRQRLGLAAALLAAPELLVLDEPANGLDPAGKRHVHGVLTSLADRGTAVVVSSHHMGDVSALCSEVTILAAGQVVYTGAISRLAEAVRSLDYRLVTTDPVPTRAIAEHTPGVQLLAGRDPQRDHAAATHVHAGTDALDDLVTRLVQEGIGVRELGPVVPPLEAAFLSLTADRGDDVRHTAGVAPEGRAHDPEPAGATAVRTDTPARSR